MSAYDYSRDKVAPPGSSLYYSVLFVTRADIIAQALDCMEA